MLKNDFLAGRFGDDESSHAAQSTIRPHAGLAGGYRKDIDGLRSLAVLPVILFHLGSGVFTGGYVGVDVFFVISGYLITSIISKELRAGDFSVVRFYERRFRRILPALFVVLIASLVAGWIILLPRDFSELGGSVAATALFASNFLFWSQAGYFDAAIELKPLAHTWSLAVEEQYYLFFPLLLAGLWRWGGRRLVGPTLLIATVSLVLSVAGVARGWSAAYYLLPFRAWELLVGSLLALVALPAVKGRWSRELLGVAALLAVMLPMLLLRSDSPFPGLNALPPVLGAALLIHLGSGNGSPSVATRLLSLKPLVWVGLLSYSLYLWHWPLIVFTRHLTLADIDGGTAAALLAMTFALSWLSWRFVEQPFRDRAALPARPLFIATAASTALASIAGLALVSADGVRSRFPEIAPFEQRILAERRDDRTIQCIVGEAGMPWPGLAGCMAARGPGTRILFWGDSHAHHFVRALRQTDNRTSANILVYGMTACVPIFDAPAPKRPDCVANKNRVFQLIKEHRIERVVIAGFWEPHRQRLFAEGPASIADTVRRLRAAGVEVVVIGDGPWFRFEEPIPLYARLLKSGRPDAPLRTPVRNDMAVNRQLARVAGPGGFFNPMSPLCRRDQCLAFDKGEPLFVDAHHLSRYGARRLIAAMGPVLD